MGKPIADSTTYPAQTAFPTGTVTFLFTDIVGSTPLWEQHPEQMAEALQVHNHALRLAIETNGGVIFKFIGDEFQAVFPIAPQALKAAIEGQLALQSAPWNELGELKVRMGLHTGIAELDPTGDEYTVSHTKNRAGRIRSTAHGGQILLSQECTDLVQRSLPPGASLLDLGVYHLKGMRIPERLFQVNAPGLPKAFPPLEAASAHPNNLPLERTSFIGREKETETLLRLIAKNRLVTLTGSGGTGKTRLALHVAAALLESYPKGAWLVELAPLSDPVLVPRTAAQALSLTEMPGKTIEQILVDFLKEKRLLLILDNCEHLLEACAALSDSLLSDCPNLTILASSREILGVEGEAPFRVPPLSMPDSRHLPPLEQVGEYDAIRLFVERAAAASTDFSLASTNAPKVAQIVQRLDGIPLAIELAAARLNLLGIDQLAERLNDTFRMLTGGSRSALPRHQTLRACIDWSYNLLSEPERILLQRLSVFAGGWSLQAAEAVCAGGPIQPEDILDMLSELLDKSLISAEASTANRKRYRMLETVRQYAHEKLLDEGEAETLRARHLAFFLQLAEALEPKIRSREQIEILDRLELELDNLRLALEWGLQADAQAELRIAAALKWFWHIHAHYSEGLDWLEEGLKRLAPEEPGTPLSQQHSFLRAKALEVLGYHFAMEYYFLARNPQSMEKTRKTLEESISIYRSLGEGYAAAARQGLGWALLILRGFKKENDDKEGFRHLIREALELFRLSGDLHGMAECYQGFGEVEFNPEKRKAFHLEQLALERSNGDIEGMATALMFLGISLSLDGRYDQAYKSFEESLGYYQLVKNTPLIVNCWLSLGVLSNHLGRPAQAKQHLEQSLTLAKEFDRKADTHDALQNLSKVEMTEGRFEQAEEWLEKAQEMMKSSGVKYDAYLSYLCIKLARLKAEPDLALRLANDILANPELAEDEKILAMLELGYLALENGDVSQAGSAWQEAFQILIRHLKHGVLSEFIDALGLLAARRGEAERAALLFGTGWSRGEAAIFSPGERRQREADLDALKKTLGERRFEELFEAGRNLTFQQAVDLALE